MDIRLGYYFVLFLDILGYKNIITRATNGPATSSSSLGKLYNAFSEAKERYGKMPGYDVKQFSDSVILSAPFEANQADSFLREVAVTQRLMLKHGILTRGGVAVGKHFHENDFVASQAVIDAYDIEQSVAKFPRVVVTDNFLSLCYPKKDYSGAPLSSFIDGAHSVDYLRDPENLDEVREAILALWANSSELDWSAREKIFWLAEYWNSRHPEREVVLPQRFIFF